MEADTLVQSPSPPWPRMRSDIQNPFQNAPGPFIYALPNLACLCPSMSADFKFIDDCSLAVSSTPDQHHHHTRYRCCFQPPPSEPPAESLPLTEEGPDADMTLRTPRNCFDENGFGDKDATITLSCCLGEGGAEIRGEQWQQQRQQPCSESSAPTPSSRTPSSATDSESSEEQDSSEKQKNENEGEGEGKEEVTKDARARVRGRRREHRQRTASDLGGRAMGPRTLTRLAPDPWMYQYQYPALYPAQYPYHGMVPYASPVWYWQPPPAPVPGFVGFA